MNLDELIKIISGKIILEINLSGIKNHDIKIKQIEIDSRKITPGDVFIAIKGNNFDGHDFIDQAINNGAVCCIVSNKINLSDYEKFNCQIILVEDTIISFGKIAKYIISNFNFPVIAITGSCGKTTTKEILAAILKTKGKVLYSDKSYNNNIGVPLTALKGLNNQDYVAAIFEIGTNHIGEIEYLSEIVRPDIAILTIVAPVHIGNFGSIEKLAHEKQQIFKYLESNGTAIVNQDDFYEFKHEVAKTKYFAINNISKANIYATDIIIKSNQQTSFNLHYQDNNININMPLLGKHNIYNILAAAQGALSLGFSLDEIKIGIEQNLATISGRLEVKSGFNEAILIDDAYNANPVAVKASLDILANYNNANSNKKCFVFADMGELGQDAEYYHKEIGETLSNMNIDYFFAYGDLVKFSIDSYTKSGVLCDSKDDLIKKLTDLIQKEKGITVLFKGSNSMGLGKVVNELVKI